MAPRATTADSAPCTTCSTAAALGAALHAALHARAARSTRSNYTRGGGALQPKGGQLASGELASSAGARNPAGGLRARLHQRPRLLLLPRRALPGAAAAEVRLPSPRAHRTAPQLELLLH